jgi:hypothetical protein
MTAVPGSSVIEGPQTLEVRWLLPGQLDTAVAGWFGRFRAETETRQDTYLVNPESGGLSVKIRGGRALEMKMCHGTAGMLEVPGRARGRIQAWQKWSLPVGPISRDGAAPDGWTVIGKTRRISRFRLAGEGIIAGAPGQAPGAPGQAPGAPGRAPGAPGRAPGAPGRAGEPRCTVELTEVYARDETWWSLGFEAAGPADLVRRALEGTAALIFARALPSGAELGLGDCRSYAEWLSRTICRS